MKLFNTRNFLPLWMILVCLSTVAFAGEPVRLASSPALSPNGNELVFSWRGDIWTVPTTGGQISRVTNSPAMDNYPEYSPDGKQLAFCSDRNGGMQIFVVPTSGGLPAQHTFHTEGCRLMDWYGDGKSFLVSAQRDHFWRHSERVIKMFGAWV